MLWSLYVSLQTLAPSSHAFRHLEQLFKYEEQQVVGQLRKLLSKEEKEVLYEVGLRGLSLLKIYLLP